MKNNNNTIRYSKKEKIGTFLFTIISLFVMDAFDNTFIGVLMVLANIFLFISVLNFIKNIEAHTKNKFNMKHYALFSLITYLLGLILLIIVVYFEFGAKLIVVSLTTLYVSMIGIFDLTLFALNKNIINKSYHNNYNP